MIDILVNMSIDLIVVLAVGAYALAEARTK